MLYWPHIVKQHYSKTFFTYSIFFSLQLAKDAEQVNKNIKKQCWNVWYEAYLLTNDESSSNTGLSTSIPAMPSLFTGARRSSSNFDSAPIAPAALNSSGLKKSRKVYCYISKKVCTGGPISANSIKRRLVTSLAVVLHRRTLIIIPPWLCVSIKLEKT